MITPEPLPRPRPDLHHAGQDRPGRGLGAAGRSTAALPGPRRSWTMAVGAADQYWSAATTPAPDAPPARTARARAPAIGDPPAAGAAAPVGAASHGGSRRRPGARSVPRRSRSGGAGGPPSRMSGPAGRPEPADRRRVGHGVSFRTFVGFGVVQISRENQRRERAPAPTATSRPRAARYGRHLALLDAPADRGTDVGVDVPQLLTALGGVRRAAGGLGQLRARVSPSTGTRRVRPSLSTMPSGVP